MQFYHYKDLWVYRIAARKWEKITAPNGPSARSGHRMIAMKKKLFVFGGFYDTGVSYKYFNDVWMFSLETYQWQQLNVSGPIAPVPRSAGCMAPTPDGKILVFGGYSKTAVKKEIDRGITHSDMFALTPESKCSSQEKYFLRVTTNLGRGKGFLARAQYCYACEMRLHYIPFENGFSFL